MKYSIVYAMLFATLGANAASLPCSIHPRTGIADSELPALARVTRAAAEASALAAVKIHSATVTSGELEAEGGCLIYSFDIRVPGRKVIEVAVDAGTGKVLSQKREGPRAQAAEAAADLAAASKKN